MGDYYFYLLRTTWPNLAVLFLIGSFVFLRLIEKARRYVRMGLDSWTIFILSSKFFLWVGILAVYVIILLSSQPDWFNSPAVFQGQVEGKAYNGTSMNPYILEVKNGSEKESLYIDFVTYQLINLGDRVNVLYLPVRKEAVRIEIVEGVNLD